MPGIGKRRKDVIPDDIVEVKQDELMKNRSKEDHAKLTGIAFGPSYQSDQNQNEFEDLNLEDFYAQTLAMCIKLGKLNKVLKDQVDTLKCELQDKTENTSHEIEVLENEKLGLHDKVVFLEKEVNDAKEKMKLTLDELRSAKLDVVISQ
ncbi:hypothetical protein GIB67_012603 [Kingdonia uniflora]|uniref:Uncharacterized protein n=1 Tax=Kingdonia uniflora TaxID=39325 RepID=A0A7J7NET9_9MAGN|nr:hypothetical protein GIB67_012603 [Kingdonia uniflora]